MTGVDSEQINKNNCNRVSQDNRALVVGGARAGVVCAEETPGSALFRGRLIRLLRETCKKLESPTAPRSSRWSTRPTRNSE